MTSTAEGRPARAETRRLEVLALLLLTVGGFVFPFVGWLAGVVLMWASSLWTTRDKLIGTLFVPGGFAPAIFLLWMGGSSSGCVKSFDPNGDVLTDTCAGTSAGEVLWGVVLALLIVLPIAAWIYLAVRLRRLSA